ncbi:hypothetical protein HS125_16070 [bacterium]|nr:hypothetical protein [bacterium]
MQANEQLHLLAPDALSTCGNRRQISIRYAKRSLTRKIVYCGAHAEGPSSENWVSAYLRRKLRQSRSTRKQAPTPVFLIVNRQHVPNASRCASATVPLAEITTISVHYPDDPGRDVAQVGLVLAIGQSDRASGNTRRSDNTASR